MGKKQVERHLLEAVRIEEQCKVYTNTKASKSLAEVKDKIHNNGIEIAQLKFAAYLLKELQPHLNGNLDNYYDKWLKSLPKDGQGEAILQ